MIASYHINYHLGNIANTAKIIYVIFGLDMMTLLHNFYFLEAILNLISYIFCGNAGGHAGRIFVFN